MSTDNNGRMLTESELKASRKAAKKAEKKTARDKANREREMGARRRR